MITCREDIKHHIGLYNKYTCSFELHDLLKEPKISVGIFNEEIAVFRYKNYLPCDDEDILCGAEMHSIEDYIWDHFNGDTKKITLFIQKLRLILS